MIKYKPYSYSKMALFKKCAANFKYKYIDKIQVDSKSFHLEKGLFFHHVLEHYPKTPPKYNFEFQENILNLNNYINTLKSCFAKDSFKELLTKHRIKAEYAFYLDESLNACKTEDDCMVKGYIDYIGKKENNELIIIDWKTGKSQACFDQLKLYGIWAFSAFVNIDNIKASFYYLEQNCEETFILTRKELPSYKDYYLNIINTIERESDFCIQKNKYCCYCDYYSMCKPFNIKMRGI